MVANLTNFSAIAAAWGKGASICSGCCTEPGWGAMLGAAEQCCSHCRLLDGDPASLLPAESLYFCLPH